VLPLRGRVRAQAPSEGMKPPRVGEAPSRAGVGPAREGTGTRLGLPAIRETPAGAGSVPAIRQDVRRGIRPVADTPGAQDQRLRYVPARFRALRAVRVQRDKPQPGKAHDTRSLQAVPLQNEREPIGAGRGEREKHGERGRQGPAPSPASGWRPSCGSERTTHAGQTWKSPRCRCQRDTPRGVPGGTD